MDKVKIGVIGGGRGKSMIRYGREASNAELVAICDFRDDVLERMKKEGKLVTVDVLQGKQSVDISIKIAK